MHPPTGSTRRVYGTPAQVVPLNTFTLTLVLLASKIAENVEDMGPQTPTLATVLGMAAPAHPDFVKPCWRMRASAAVAAAAVLPNTRAQSMCPR